jgi:hypothetical protein
MSMTKVESEGEPESRKTKNLEALERNEVESHTSLDGMRQLRNMLRCKGLLGLL